MDKSTFEDAWNWLSKSYQKQLDAKARDHYWTTFQDVDDSLFIEAIDRCVHESQSFPTPGELNRYVTLVREGESKDKKPISEPKVVNQLGRDSFTLMKRVQRGGDLYPMSEHHPQVYEAMMEMERKYPGKGWYQEARQYGDSTGENNL